MRKVEVCSVVGTASIAAYTILPMTSYNAIERAPTELDVITAVVEVAKGLGNTFNSILDAGRETETDAPEPSNSQKSL